MKPLEIRRLTRYTIAKYPRGQYREKAPVFAESLVKRGAVSLAMLALLESSACDETGTTGPPPVMPKLVTENEARQIITQAFGTYGIDLHEDVGLMLHFGQNDSMQLTLDGFKSSLGVGYEYISGLDGEEFTPAVRNALDSLLDEQGPYITSIDAVETKQDYETILREAVDEFIDTLKAHGII